MLSEFREAHAPDELDVGNDWPGLAPAMSGPDAADDLAAETADNGNSYPRDDRWVRGP
ncbi:hypothetical protein [Streptomyces sp. NPDC047985]|uniref:hypothetical protein n=1 Tax=Streptomyces sp. NPDC047985 TaxID=3155384 RepID=UPI00342597E7